MKISQKLINQILQFECIWEGKKSTVKEALDLCQGDWNVINCSSSGLRRNCMCLRINQSKDEWLFLVEITDTDTVWTTIYEKAHKKCSPGPAVVLEEMLPKPMIIIIFDTDLLKD